MTKIKNKWKCSYKKRDGWRKFNFDIGGFGIMNYRLKKALLPTPPKFEGAKFVKYKIRLKCKVGRKSKKKYHTFVVKQLSRYELRKQRKLSEKVFREIEKG